MNITLTLNEEEVDAIAARALEGESASECVTRHALALVRGWVTEDTRRSGVAAVEACLNLPKADRDEILALIAQKTQAQP